MKTRSSYRSIAFVMAIGLVAVFVSACDSPAEKPTAEPPTPVPTVDSSSETSDEAGSTTRPGTGFRQGLTGGPLADPEVRACIEEAIGGDRIDQFGRGSGIGLDPESLEAFEECGLDIQGAAEGFRRFGDREGLSDERGIFGGVAPGGGFADISALQECLSEQLGPNALPTPGKSSFAITPELQEALAVCGARRPSAIEPEVENPDGGDSAPEIEPTSTPVPVNDLTIEQLTCLSGELDPSALASAVVAASSGDLDSVTDEVLAALQACGVGT